MDINVGLYLVRHGETDWNIESKIQGRTDTELNEKGRRQAQELAVGGGVPPPAVLLPDGPGGHDLLPGQGVDQAGLAHAGGPQKGNGLPGEQIGVQRLQPLAGPGADGVHRRARSRRLGLSDKGGGVPGQVRLGQHYHRLRPGLPGHRQIALQALEVEVLVH